jgi:hypothetical protein
VKGAIDEALFCARSLLQLLILQLDQLEAVAIIEARLRKKYHRNYLHCQYPVFDHQSHLCLLGRWYSSRPQLLLQPAEVSFVELQLFSDTSA